MAVCRPALSPSAQRPNELLVIALCLFPPTRHSSSLYVALKQIKSKKKREDAEKDLKAKMEEVKRKREAIDLVDGEYRFFQSLADKTLVVLNA